MAGGISKRVHGHPEGTNAVWHAQTRLSAASHAMQHSQTSTVKQVWPCHPAQQCVQAKQVRKRSLHMVRPSAIGKAFGLADATQTRTWDAKDSDVIRITRLLQSPVLQVQRDEALGLAKGCSKER
jgi:hypothetical protein